MNFPENPRAKTGSCRPGRGRLFQLCSAIILAIVCDMAGEGKKPFMNRDRFRRWPAEVESKFPMIPISEGSKITVKQVAYLHAYCKESPAEIASRFPKQLSLGQVHLALAHYYLTEKKAIDDELAREFRLNTRDALLENSLSLPPRKIERA